MRNSWTTNRDEANGTQAARCVIVDVRTTDDAGDARGAAARSWRWSGTSGPRATWPRIEWPWIAALIALAALALLLALVWWFVPLIRWGLVSLTLVVLSARWVNVRAAAASVICFSTTAAVWSPGIAAFTQIAPAALMMLFFALANLPGRTEPAPVNGLERKPNPAPAIPWLRVTFFVLLALVAWSGWQALVATLGGCLLYLASTADARGLRFFYDRVGLGLVAAALLARLLLVPWSAEIALTTLGGAPLASLRGAALATLPWSPLVAIAVVAGIRQGRYATPLWRLLGCWILAAAAVGLVDRSSAVGHALAPLAIIAGAALTRLWTTRHRWPAPLRGLWMRGPSGRVPRPLSPRVSERPPQSLAD